MRNLKSILLTFAIVVFGAAQAVAGELIINIKPKYNPLPPQAFLYLQDPGQFFNLSITNPDDEPIDVYLGLHLEQLEGSITGNGEKLDIYTPTNYQPVNDINVLHLAPSTTKVLNKMQVNNAFNFYPESQITGLSGILSRLQGNAIGLLPEGKFRLTVIAYRYDRTVENPQAISNPTTNWCEFDIRYNADEPQLQGLDAIVDVDHSGDKNYRPEFGNPAEVNLTDQTNTFQWSSVFMNINPVPTANYTLEIWRIQNYKLDDLEKYPTLKVYSGEAGTATQKTLPPLKNDARLVNGEYYAMRVVATSSVTDPTQRGYMQIRNGGKSEWKIVRLTNKDVITGEGNTIAASADDDEQDNWLCTIGVPVLKSPDNKGDGTARQMLQKPSDGKIKVTWEKPALEKAKEAGGKDFFNSLNFSYDVGIYHIPSGFVDQDSILRMKPVAIKENVSGTSTTFNWDADHLKDSIQINKDYAIIVKANIKSTVQDGQVAWTGKGKNSYTFGYYLTAAEAFKGCDCELEFADPKPALWEDKGKEIKDEWTGLYVGHADKEQAFPFVITQATRTDEGKFTGKGYVVWTPNVAGKTIRVPISVTFKDIQINAGGQVVAGTVESTERTDVDWIPYRLIDYGKAKVQGWADNGGWLEDVVNFSESAASSVDEFGKKYTFGVLNKGLDMAEDELAKQVKKYTDPKTYKEMCGTYWDKISDYGAAASNIYALTDAFFQTDLKSNPITLPLRMPNDLVEAIHTDISLMSMKFTPAGASFNAMMLFKMPEAKEDASLKYSEVLAFTLSDMCVSPKSLWATDAGTAALAYDIELEDVKNDFTFTFKAPTDPAKIASIDDMDGCAIHWEHKSSKLSFALCLAGDMKLPKLKDKDGKNAAKAGFRVKIEDWSDFTVRLTMDPFTLDDCKDYVFYPGETIIWDHSEKFNEEGVKFPATKGGFQGYDWQKWDKGFAKQLEAKPVLWQGLYIENLKVQFPKGIEVTDIEPAEGEEKAERHLAVGLSGLIIDKTGVTLTGELTNILDLSTCKAGGWALSIDNINFNVVQSEFRDCGFSGNIKIPILSGSFDYDCKIALQSKEWVDSNVNLYSEATYDGDPLKDEEKRVHLTFTTKPKDDMNFDFILGKVWSDQHGSWLNINYLEGHGTDIELMCSGTITIGSGNSKTKSKISALPFELPGIRFAGMRVANFSVKSKGRLETPPQPYPTGEGVLKFDSSMKTPVEGNNNTPSPEGEGWGGVPLTAREADITFGDDKNPSHIYFNMGDWSFASGQKRLWNTPFTLDGWGVKFESTTVNGKKGFTLGLGVYGGIFLIDQGDSNSLHAAVGLSICSDLIFDLNDIRSTKFENTRVKLDSLGVKGDFGRDNQSSTKNSKQPTTD